MIRTPTARPVAAVARPTLAQQLLDVGFDPDVADRLLAAYAHDDLAARVAAVRGRRDRVVTVYRGINAPASQFRLQFSDGPMAKSNKWVTTSVNEALGFADFPLQQGHGTPGIVVAYQIFDSMVAQHDWVNERKKTFRGKIPNDAFTNEYAHLQRIGFPNHNGQVIDDNIDHIEWLPLTVAQKSGRLPQLVNPHG